MRKQDFPTYVNPGNLALLWRAIERREVTGNFLPAVFVIEPVSRCNLACVMCPNRKMPQSDLGEMSLERFEQVVCSISPFCEFLMLYWMGEPTLHSRFTELLRLARRHIRGRIVVSTNMTVDDEAVYRALLENADIVLCCIDRWEKSAYERIRVGANFESVVRNTENLLSLRGSGTSCEVVVKALDLNSTSLEHEDFQEHWKQRGARPLVAWLNDWAGTFQSMRNAAAMPVPRSERHRTPCADLWFKLVMNWRGEIQMCCFDWQYKYNVGRVEDLEGWLPKAWHSTEMESLRRAHADGQWDVTPLCETCTTWGEPAELEAYVNFTESSYFTVF